MSIRGGDSIANRIAEITKAEIVRVGILSESIIKAAVQGNLEKYYPIINYYVKPSGDLTPYLSLDESGKVVVSAKVKEKLREEYSSYVATEKGLEIYNAHKKMIDSVNEFIRTFPHISANNVKGFICINFGEEEVVRTSVGYDRTGVNM